ncbi:HAD family hydrolase [Thermostaphylospora chromogena]|uniref:Haloacid dehalogenase superfamily, subfamily IA, variant 3 with third motif having DD or ED/beta-phosphoglucomutase family hydrolase n=1 Tax=Thermostaphylospora chromogena TaxID=35622 RepID=A0A1H1GXB7_9ACTN|nr:HAD-IA family hydrolase [Thermostaphylospora chromogena]SDR17486.1 haloacid dehalogenase superfamily, subfamily IA, variant 3 with third motif having DD or ED/beta-phosphoglucomutase family hydrolase [Thermostaphylospora chromogena]
MAALDLNTVSAVIFDTDGVVTDSARVHAAAWKHVFDTFLTGRGGRPFDIREDYLRYVDGRPRHDGVRTFLASRGITLPEEAPPGTPSVRSLAEAKDALFLEQLERYGVAAFPGTVALLHDLRHRGARTAVVSASRNCSRVVTAAAVAHLFDVLVDGNDAARLGLPGKPDPALFLEAARRLGVAPERAAVVEDALPGVEAGRRGGFGLVVGVDRTGGGAAGLAAAGADIVVADLDELEVTGRVPVNTG